MRPNFPFSILNSQFRDRSSVLERLDTGDYTSQEYAHWLGDMRLIHAFFGEIRALKKTLLKEIGNSVEDNVALLDVGAGTGDLLRDVGKSVKTKRVFLAGVDVNFESADSINSFGAAAVQCDAMRLPFAADSFDHVFCSLVLHHLTDEDAVKLLAEMSRVSRGKIFVVDLNRDAKAYYTFKLLAPIFFQRLTAEDGALSILRSRTPDELHQLARMAGLQQVEVEHSRLNRLVLSGVGNE